MSDANLPSAPEPESEAGAERVYRVRLGWRIFLLIFGLVFGGLALAGWLIVPARSPWALAFVCTPLVVLGAWAIRGAIVQRLILRGQALEVRGAFTVRELRADQAKGRRSLTSNGTQTLTIEPLDPKAKPLKFELIYETDAQLAAWLAAIPDLDALEIQESSSALLAERPAWESQAQRSDRIELARRAAKIVNGAALATSLWALILPRPYALAVALVASMPWLALFVVANSGRLIRLDTKRNDVRPHVAPAFLLPSGVLAMRALSDCHVLDLTRALAVGAAVAIIMTLAACIVDAGFRRIGPIVAALFLSAMYAGGATLCANALLDRGRYTTFHPRVLAKHVSSGKQTMYHLKLEPWGPLLEADDVTVPRRTYERAAIGGPVRVALHPGALSIRWITIQIEAPQTASAH